MIYLHVNDSVLEAELVNNSSTKALLTMLENGPITVKMRDYANMEKVGTLPKSLPRNDTPIDAESGDIILYQGNALVIYYDHNSWNFTKLGTIKDVSQNELKQILGKGSVSVTLSLQP